MAGEFGSLQILVGKQLEAKDMAGKKIVRREERLREEKDMAGRERCPKQKIWREKRYGEGKDMAGKKIRRMKRYGGKIQL